MPLYEYKAYNINGKVYKSRLESSSLENARSKLFELNIPFVAIKEKSKFVRKRIKKESLFLFCEQLSQLVESNIPLYESLELLKEQFQTDPFFNILDGLLDCLKSGLSFSQSLKKYPHIFNSFFCALVSIGEESGHLSEALKKLALELNRELKISKQVQQAMLYPSILMCFCFLLVGILIFFIVPSIDSLFESSSPNLFTQTVINICTHLKDTFFVYLSLIALLIISLRLLIKSSKYKSQIDEYLLKVPLLKTFLKEIAFARWTSTMAMLLLSKLPLLDSLVLSSNLLKNKTLQQALLACETKVKEGSSLSSELKKNNLFPPLLIRMITVGETSGELDHSFERLALLYEESVGKKMAKLLTLLSPIILVGMALFIGMIMLAILIPLTDINSFSL